MNVTLAFDVYGTLIDTHGIIRILREHMGDKAELFSHMWRQKQLEYSFRRGLMQNYVSFATCTKQALEFTCNYLKTPLAPDTKELLLTSYGKLPPFDDVLEGLKACRDSGFRLFAFSNGTRKDVGELLKNAGLEDFFQDVISVEDIRSFKPNPGVYCHFMRKAGVTGAESWLISSNPFDVIGAISAGMRAAWVRRTPEAVFDPWEIRPTIVIDSLIDLPENIKNIRGN